MTLNIEDMNLDEFIEELEFMGQYEYGDNCHLELVRQAAVHIRALSEELKAAKNENTLLRRNKKIYYPPVLDA